MNDITEQQRTLATHVRTHMAGQGVVFSPWFGLDLSYRDGTLYRTTPNVPTHQRSYTPLATIDELHDATDEEIWQKVMG